MCVTSLYVGNMILFLYYEVVEKKCSHSLRKNLFYNPWVHAQMSRMGLFENSIPENSICTNAIRMQIIDFLLDLINAKAPLVTKTNSCTYKLRSISILAFRDLPITFKVERQTLCPELWNSVYRNEMRMCTGKTSWQWPKFSNVPHHVFQTNASRSEKIELFTNTLLSFYWSKSAPLNPNARVVR